MTVNITFQPGYIPTSRTLSGIATIKQRGDNLIFELHAEHGEQSTGAREIPVSAIQAITVTP